MSNKQKTAVEYMFGLLFNSSLPKEEQFKIFNVAKEMEKQQIVDAFEAGKWDSMALKGTPNKQYYKETYE